MFLRTPTIARVRCLAVARCARVCARSSCALAARLASRGRSGSACGVVAAAARSPRWRPSGHGRIRRWCTATAPAHRSQTSGSNSTTVPNVKRLHLSIGARDRPVAEIQRKGRLGKQAAVVRLPRFAHDLAAPAEHLIDERAVDVPAVNQQVVDGEALALHVASSRTASLRPRDDSPA